MPYERLCLVTRIPGVAGPASFQRRLAAGLEARGVRVCYSLGDRPYGAVLVVGGTRQLAGLWRARKGGLPILQRLDGINWIHRRRRTGPRHFLRAELNNAVLRFTRDRLASGVVYQSEFARRWWEKAYGMAPVPGSVVHNGVPLDAYTPHGKEERPGDHVRLLVVEGNLAGGYEVGMEAAARLVSRLMSETGRPVELAVAGRVPEGLRAGMRVERPSRIRWLGLVPPEGIPALDRSAHLLFAADLLPACPNAVIEALACGLPVISFDTGALPEIVMGDAGRLVPYGGDPWRLDPPDVNGLADAAAKVIAEQPRFRMGARARAEAGLGLDRMVEGYLQALGWA